MMIGSSVRTRVVQEMYAGDGLGYKDDPPGRRDSYCQLILPFDTKEFQLDEGKVGSSCLLYGMSIYRGLKVPYQPLNDPYQKHLGMAGAIFHAMTLNFGCWWDCANAAGVQAYLNEDGGFNLGDSLWIGLEKQGGGADPAYGGVSHLTNIVDIIDGQLTDGTDIQVHVAMDGGQSDDPGYQIKKCHRLFENTGTQIWARSLTPTQQDHNVYTKTQGRRVFGVCDPTKGLMKGILEGTWGLPVD